MENIGDASGYEALSPTSSTGITSTLITPTTGDLTGKNARSALIEVETNPIRFKENGDAASATDGIKVDAGQSYRIEGGANVKNFRCIDTAVGASSVQVIVYH